MTKKGDDEVYQHRVFFTCHAPLLPPQRGAVLRHFSLKHKSGGGDCGPLTHVRGDEAVYSVAFQSQTAQQRVLQKSEHVVQCADGPLLLTMLGMVEPAVAGVAPFGPSQEPTSLRQPRLSAAEDSESQGEWSLSAALPMEDEAATATQEVRERVFSPVNLGPAQGGVQVEAVAGTVESQQVDVLVSPMVKTSPLATRVGKTLSELGGISSDLITRFIMADGQKSEAGDNIVVEGSRSIPAKAVIFLNLIPRAGVGDHTAVQVLRTSIYNLLRTCDARGFESVALPVLGAGSVLHFPPEVFLEVLMEEVQCFAETRQKATPLLLRVTIHPTDTRSCRVFKGYAQGFDQLDQTTAPRRYILLGKSGTGKSSLANTLIGAKEVFATGATAHSTTHSCQAESWGAPCGPSATLIDTPGFFDTDRSDTEVRSEITRFAAECAPGIHAFLLVLRVDRYTEQEHQVVLEILHCISNQALEYTVVVFTHGNQLPDGQTIQQFVGQNSTLKGLVAKCGGRCHVFDNRYWNDDDAKDEYRSNRFQTQELLKTIDRMLMEKGGRSFTTETLQLVGRRIQTEAEFIQSTVPEPISQAEAEQLAKGNVSKQLLNQVVGVATGSLLAFVFSGSSGLFSVLAGLAGGAVAFNAVEDASNPLEAAGLAFKAITNQKTQFNK